MESVRLEELQNALKVAGKEAESGENLHMLELVTAATHDEHPPYSLREIQEAVAVIKPSNLLDPLQLFPLLIPSSKDGASELLQLIATEGSAKEAVIAVRESLQDLKNKDHDEGEQEPYSVQILRLISISERCLPRSRIRKEGPIELTKPILDLFFSAIGTITPLSTKNEGLKILVAVSEMIETLKPWLATDHDLNTKPELIEGLLSHFLLNIVGSCASHIDPSLAEYRLGEFKLSPIFARDVRIEDGIQAEMRTVLRTAQSLNLTSEKLISHPLSLGKLILLAYQDSDSIPTQPQNLESLLPILSSSLTHNIATDATLSLLLTFIHANSSFSEELVDTLATLLNPFTSNQPDPRVRYIAFRVLAELISRAPPAIHFAHLASLVSDCPFPRMRVAAVGLVKDAYLKAISSDAESNSPFRTNALLRAFGPILFRPDPPELFSSLTDNDFKKFVESSEPARLTQCLAFYYVLLMRDTGNSTGVRDPDMKRTVETGLLTPIRRALAAWMGDDVMKDPHRLIPLAGLEVQLDSIDRALASI